MTYMTQSTRLRRAWGKVALVLTLSVLAACDSLLEVELPGQVVEAETFVPAQARLLVNSAIADIECALSDLTAFDAAGYEDNTTRTVGWWGSRFERAVSPPGGRCSTGETSVGWFSPLHAGRWMAEQVYARLENEWTTLPDREELMGTAAIYAGLVYTTFGELFCEVTADGGPLMTHQESLALAEQWFTDALTHIGNVPGGDYAIQTGVTSSAQQMAYLLRARARFDQGEDTPAKLTLAADDAAMVTNGFTSFLTREGGGERTRWNRVYSAHVGLGWVILLGPVDWWTGTTSNQPGFLGGGPWPAVIPFTGYWELAIDQTTGRAVSDTGHPLTLADANTVADPRVLSVPAGVGGIGAGGGPYDYPQWEQRKYTSQADDFPLAKWEEARLIQAQVAGGQTAIDMVNQIRTAHGLPQVTGAYVTAGEADKIQIMVLEEIRRTHYIEAGRWWSTKLRYDLWFPRGEGQDRYNFGYQTGVRMVFPGGEYTTNPNLTDADRGSGCTPDQNPV